MLNIRPEIPQDIDAIHKVNESAFKTPAEADLVDKLRRRLPPKDFISLVAEQDGQIVGHILFTPVTIASPQGIYHAVGLGPMAVLPAYQRQGIGSQLVHSGLEACRQVGHEAVIVLGHPEFYPRFGFVPSTHYDIRWEVDVPEEVFMALELVPGALQGRGGVVSYQPEFNGV